MGRVPALAERRVFVDSSAYLALLDRDDEHYEEATVILRALASQRYRQFTTNILVIEAHALVLSTLRIGAGHAFLRGMERSSTALVRIRVHDEEHARGIVYQYSDKDFSLADAISFAVMDRLRITRIFTLGRHFAQYGFSALAPPL